MIAKIFLAFVGVMYAALSLWCTLAPATTSKKVGFDLLGGSGKSEYLVIYGGLEMALGIVFLLPLWKSDYTEFSLWFCTILHGCLVLYRTISLFQFSEIGSLTYKLAVGEWVIFIACVALLFFQRSN